MGEDSITLEVAFGPVRLHDEYRLEGSIISRDVQVENQSDIEIQVKGLRLMLLGALIGSTGNCIFEAPATILRPRIPLERMIGLREDLTSDRSLVPGAVGWLDFVGSAPDMAPGLIAIHNPSLKETLMIWYYSEVEAAVPRIFGGEVALDLGHDMDLACRIAPGASLGGGTQYIGLVHGTWGEALDTFSQCYSRLGVEPTLYGTPPDWVPKASIYEVHPGQFGGFRGLAEQLAEIRAIGFDVLYLMPVMRYNNPNGAVWDENWLGSGSPYAMKDFEAFEPTLGTEVDFRFLVDQAHTQGMKVLMDFVAQGSALDARYVQDQPGWYCRDEGGELVSSHGWTDTYSLDWANPEYQGYMLDWAMRFVREYGIDGYRVDAPHGKEPNWDRSLPYHASYTSLGSLRMLEELQRGVKAIDPEAALLCESFGPIFVKSHDFQYDYHPHGMVYGLLQDNLTPHEFGAYLDDYWAVMPPSAKRVCFTETHDTRVGFPAYGWRGSAAERAMFAILILAGFIPMVWSGQEAGLENFYRTILEARLGSPALLYGKRRFNTIHCDNPKVVSIACAHGDDLILGIVSLYAERTPLTFDLSSVFEPGSTGVFQLHDLISEQDWSEYGCDRWPCEGTQAITLSLIPFAPYFFRVIDA